MAANHPSYLDPVLLSLQVSRPIRFMAWERLFRIPLLGPFIRAFGAFPVDTRRGKGRQAYARARDLVMAGEVVGIFPEGRRSPAGWMEHSLREGAARLALETAVPLVPATITGAFRAWPHFQSLPKPARIRVRFHDPIDPAPYRSLPEAEALDGLLGELRRRVERSLLPGIKADLRTSVLYRMPALRIVPGAGPGRPSLLEDAIAGGGGAGLRLPGVPAPRPLRDPALAPGQVDPQRLSRPVPARLRAPGPSPARAARRAGGGGAGGDAPRRAVPLPLRARAHRARLRAGRGARGGPRAGRAPPRAARGGPAPGSAALRRRVCVGRPDGILALHRAGAGRVRAGRRAAATRGRRGDRARPGRPAGLAGRTAPAVSAGRGPRRGAAFAGARVAALIPLG
ncbi:MAG: hypothetical protein DMF81_02510 [Acidobacteria bacterium]|nr:MAG: hypothetical protein DMF81_02510 [Acidobacteriota bacterium]